MGNAVQPSPYIIQRLAAAEVLEERKEHLLYDFLSLLYRQSAVPHVAKQRVSEFIEEPGDLVLQLGPVAIVFGRGTGSGAQAD